MEDTSLATGLGLVAQASGSMHASPHFPGAAKTVVTVAAVLVDSAGVIRACAIDGVDVTLPFSRAGQVLYEPGALFPSKQTLEADYGMHKASAIGREWHQQADEVAAWCVGKQAEALQPGDVTTSATINTAPLTQAVALAVENAAFLGASQGDSLALAAFGESRPGLEATAAAPGLAACRLAAMCFTVRGGAVTSRQEGALSSSVTFSREGQLLSDVSLPLSHLSSVLRRTELTERERRALESALQP